MAAESRALLTELRGAAAEAAGAARDLARHLAAADALLALGDGRGRARLGPAGGRHVGDAIEIVGGRHPVVEVLGPFQPNDARLVARGERDQLGDPDRPEHGRQEHLDAAGCADRAAGAGRARSCRPTSARIGLVDGIFTRIGAVDDLAGGRSTFMVEMEETASVLRAATDRSLIVLDEIGRGTSTHDGMAIAWSVAEHLATGPVRPRAVVATHYHELAALARRASPGDAAPRDGRGAPGGDRRSRTGSEPGAADRSFGIEVARLAGPAPGSAGARPSGGGRGRAAERGGRRRLGRAARPAP